MQLQTGFPTHQFRSKHWWPWAPNKQPEIPPSAPPRTQCISHCAWISAREESSASSLARVSRSACLTQLQITHNMSNSRWNAQSTVHSRFHRRASRALQGPENINTRRLSRPRPGWADHALSCDVARPWTGKRALELYLKNRWISFIHSHGFLVDVRAGGQVNVSQHLWCG